MNRRLAFMVIGPPRSGTTWAANWLTSPFILCYHDPCAYMRVDELDRLADDPVAEIVGVSDTSLMYYADIVNAHPCPKVILHRDAAEVDRSLAQLGLHSNYVNEDLEGRLNKIKGLHVHYTELFSLPAALTIGEYLTPGKTFNPFRHHELCKMKIEPLRPFNYLKAAKEYNMTLAK